MPIMLTVRLLELPLAYGVVVADYGIERTVVEDTAHQLAMIQHQHNAYGIEAEAPTYYQI